MQLTPCACVLLQGTLNGHMAHAAARAGGRTLSALDGAAASMQAAATGAARAAASGWPLRALQRLTAQTGGGSVAGELVAGVHSCVRAAVQAPT